MSKTKSSLSDQAKTGAKRPRVLDYSRKPLIMGILNVTPDSFSDGGKYLGTEKAIARALTMIDEGADIIDIGGESTRPGAPAVTADQELERVMPVIERLAGEIEIPLSIDTRKAEVAEQACRAGAAIINDISGLESDNRLADIAHEYNAYLILMHMRGTPENMQTLLEYDDLIKEISEFLAGAAQKAQSKGVARDRVIIDPGIGFAKSVDDNFRIIKHIPEFNKLGYPVLIGASRKSFIGKTLDLPASDRLEGSLAAAVSAMMYGAAILRVHDVQATVRALTIAARIEEAD